MRFSEDIDAILDVLIAANRDRLEANLVGIYVRGSLAAGDFRPESSDIDVLTVTERPVSDEEFAALYDLHTSMDKLANPYAGRLEIAYIDRAALRRFRPGMRHPTLGQGETLVWSEHHSNWILERWTVREHGIALFGPDPHTLIDAVSPQELRSAVRARLRDWTKWAQDENDPDWQLHRSHKAYVVETMCRVLYTLTCGELKSKRESVDWALRTVPEPWRTTVGRSQLWLNDQTVDLAIVPEVRQFVLWATSEPEID